MGDHKNNNNTTGVNIRNADVRADVRRVHYLVANTQAMNKKTRSCVRQVLLTLVDSEEAASSELAIFLHITLHLTSHINNPHISIRNRHIYIYRQPPA